MDHFDEFLADHADCERKASAMALRLVGKCPDRPEIIPPLIDLALEELTHFRQVYDLMLRRRVPLARNFIDDPYVNALLKLLRSGRDERFLDHLLVLAVVESRGAERFGILYRALRDPELREFYRRLHIAETKHGGLFLRLAAKYFSAAAIARRLRELAASEGEIIQKLKWRPSLH